MIIQSTINKISSPEHAEEVFRSIYNMRDESDQHREMFYAMCLNAQNTILAIDLIGIGTTNACAPFVKECFKMAIMKNASAIIVCHNHPSGDTTPSREDKIFTQKIKDAAHILGINFLDHLIIGDKYYSFSDHGGI